MKYYFLDLTMNCDGVEIYSAEVLTESELESYKNFFEYETSREDICYHVGGKHDLYLLDTDVLDIINNAREITEEEYNSFKSIFEDTSFGELCLLYLEDYFSEEPDEDEDEDDEDRDEDEDDEYGDSEIW